MTNNDPAAQALRAWAEISMHHSMHARTRFIRSVGLSMPQLGILMQLHHRGQCGISELGGKFDITSAAASQLVEKLVQAGYIARTENPQDRRARQLTLTGKGHKLIQDGIQQSYNWSDRLASQLSSEECALVEKTMAILKQAAIEMKVDLESKTPNE